MLRFNSRCDAGWHEALVPQINAGATYHFRIDDEIDVPDPASRFNPQGLKGPCEVIDSGGDSRTDISAIKIFVPAAFERVVDRAIQVHGAMGVSGDTPLAGMYTGARTLRIADGPDEVHRIVIAKNVMKQYHDGMSWDFGV